MHFQGHNGYINLGAGELGILRPVEIANWSSERKANFVAAFICEKENAHEKVSHYAH